MAFRTLLLLLAAALTAACEPRAVQIDQDPTAAPLAGAWRLVAAESVAPDGTIRQGQPQESLLLIAPPYYSMNWASGAAPAPFSAQRFNPTDEEKAWRYGSLIVNAGRFEVDGSMLLTYPTFALVPEYVGGFGQFEFEVRGDTLSLEWQQIRSADGLDDPNVQAGLRFRYRWVRMTDDRATAGPAGETSR